MKLRPHIASFLVPLVSLIMISSCGAPDNSASIEFNRLADQYWNWRLVNEPIFAMSINKGYVAEQFDDMSLEILAAQRQYRGNLLSRLDSLAQQNLPGSDMQSLTMLKWRLTNEIKHYDLGGHLLAISLSRGPHVDLPQLALSLALKDISDCEAYLALLNSIPDYLAQVQALLREGINKGMVQPKGSMKAITTQLRDLVNVSAERGPFYAPLKKLPASISATEQERLQQIASRDLDELVLPAFEQFFEFIKGDYTAACRVSYAAANLPNGSEYYQLQLDRNGVPYAPDKLHALALAEADSLFTVLDTLMRELEFEGDLATFAWELRNKSTMFVKEPEDLLNAYEKIFNSMEPFLENHIPGLAPALPTVVAMPINIPLYKQDTWYESADSNGAFVVNTMYHYARPIWRMESLALRYGPAGSHALHTTLKASQLPEFRKHLQVAAFESGWSWYVGTLGNDFGLFDGPYSRYGHLVEEMIEIVRLAVDTGIHSQGWDRQDAMQYFAKYTPLPAHRMSSEIDNIVTQPGSATAAKAGQYKFLSLRKTATALNSDASISDFHKTLLENGPLTFDLIEGKIPD